MLSDEDKARVGSGLIRCKKEKAPLHGAARLDSQEYIVITEDKDGAASSRLWDDPNVQAGLAEGKRLIAAKEKAERAKRLAEATRRSSPLIGN